MPALTLIECQAIVAKKHRLGEKLVTGHKKGYFDEAAILFAQGHVKEALLTAEKKVDEDETGNFDGDNHENFMEYVNLTKAFIRESYPIENIKYKIKWQNKK